MLSLTNQVPVVYTEVDVQEQSFAALVDTADSMQATLLDAIQELAGVALASFTPAPFILQVANDHGNPFPFMSASRFQDKVEALVAIYQRRGTKQGIISVCYFLCGVKVAIVEEFDWGWKLQDAASLLTTNTRLANGDAPTFWIMIAASVPQQVQDELGVIINFMKPASHQWRFVTVAGIIPMGALESAVVANENLTVIGWAASKLEGAPVAWVDIQLDGLSIGHADLDEVTIRNDVQVIMAAAGSVKDCTKSQFSFVIPLGNVPQGAHVVSAVATQIDGQVGVVGIQNINI